MLSPKTSDHVPDKRLIESICMYECANTQPPIYIYIYIYIASTLEWWLTGTDKFANVGNSIFTGAPLFYANIYIYIYIYRVER